MKDLSQMSKGYYHPKECNLNEFEEIINQSITMESVPNAVSIENNIPIYDISSLEIVLKEEKLKNELMAEWGSVLRSGSGAIVLRNAYRDTTVIDEATVLYQDIINDVDAVSIVVPTNLHYKIAKFFIEHKKHVLIEKPFATNVLQCY